MLEQSWDVIVVGGGLSGVTAAVAAARNGARTLLVEKDGSLGGTMTMCLVGPMMTFHSATEQVVAGLAQEIVDRLVEMRASPGHILDTTGYVATVTPFHAEALRLLCQQLVTESGAALLFHATVVDVVMEGHRIKGVVLQHRGTQVALQAAVVVDATGDADVAFRAGVQCEVGRPEDGRVQPVTMMFKVGTWDRAAFTDYAVEHPEELRLSREGIEPYRREPLIAVCGFREKLQVAIEAGDLADLQREHVLFFNTHRPDEVIVNMSRVVGIDPLDPVSLTRAELAGRQQVALIMAFLRREIPGFSNAHIEAVGARVGVRESRRIVGAVQLTAQDVTSSRDWPDVIARSAYPIDIHSPTGVTDPNDEGLQDDFVSKGVTYGIPYRALLPGQIDGLLVAGRIISTTAEAHGATRVSPTCMACGQAAGTAAALAVGVGTAPRDVDIRALQRVMVTQGALLGKGLEQ